MTSKEYVLSVCPSAHLVGPDEGPFEVWFKRYPEEYEIIGGGQTEEEAWKSAADYLKETPSDLW